MKIAPHIYNLVVLRDSNDLREKNDDGLLRLMLCNEPFSSFFLGCLKGIGDSYLAVPQHWAIPDAIRTKAIVNYSKLIPIYPEFSRRLRENSWIAVHDGRFLSIVDNRLINEMLSNSSADVVAVNIAPQLRASYEKVLTVSQNELVGFRMFYEDAAQPAPLPGDWPHRLYIRTAALNNFTTEGGLPLTFAGFLEMCCSRSLRVSGANAGGYVLDLNSEQGLLELMRSRLSSSVVRSYYSPDNNAGRTTIADSARLFGENLLGKCVNIDENAIIAGPTIIADNVKIGKDAVVRASIIGPGISVQAGEFVEERVLAGSSNVPEASKRKKHKGSIGTTWGAARFDSSPCPFRQWPRFSYAMFIKRVIDIIVSVIVLILFAPVFPIIMLVIKLTSTGPIFFKDARQSLWARTFKCLKFRTMKVDSHRMQERLRVLNQADGPQFMIEDDPRMSSVGKFLRETYIDEIPQFVNVLLGQMSIVGPRPSPESENRLCPFWRDARLSVRPGITGLWQICRTRQPMRDFQEWIHYDVKYVKDLSLMLDLWLCWRTAKKMVMKFISQF